MRTKLQDPIEPRPMSDAEWQDYLSEQMWLLEDEMRAEEEQDGE